MNEMRKKHTRETAENSSRDVEWMNPHAVCAIIIVFSVRFLLFPSFSRSFFYYWNASNYSTSTGAWILRSQVEFFSVYSKLVKCNKLGDDSFKWSKRSPVVRTFHTFHLAFDVHRKCTCFQYFPLSWSWVRVSVWMRLKKCRNGNWKFSAIIRRREEKWIKKTFVLTVQPLLNKFEVWLIKKVFYASKCKTAQQLANLKLSERIGSSTKCQHL